MSDPRQAWVDEVSAGYDTEPEVGFGPLAVDVEPAGWVDALRVARDGLGCDFFDFLTAVDDEADGFVVVAHVARRQVGHVDTVLVRTRVSREAPCVDSLLALYAGAGWHERETHEMFGIDFAGNDGLAPLLLPDGFEGHPLRKEFVLASRVAKPWPGAKEPGESDGEAAPSRRRTRPPGVPDPQLWGPHAQAESDGPEAGGVSRAEPVE